MDQKSEARYWRKTGLFFQLPLMVTFVLSAVLTPGSSSMIGYVFSVVGGMLIIWSMNAFYIQQKKHPGLIVDGPCRYTRHPMYLGFFLMNLRHWTVDLHGVSAWFYVSEIVFIISLVIAAYMQERETIARFGQEAVDYYARTPRVPFLV